MTETKGDKDELKILRVVTGWRVPIDYIRNEATRKDHFLLLFIDQMLNRLTGYAFYYSLVGYSGYN